MWHLHALVALDLARERADEARAMAWADRAVPHRGSAVRRLSARALRNVSDAAAGLSQASASAARSLEGAG